MTVGGKRKQQHSARRQGRGDVSGHGRRDPFPGARVLSGVAGVPQLRTPSSTRSSETQLGAVYSEGARAVRVPDDESPEEAVG